MTPERWRQIEDLCHKALARPAGERAAFLAAACVGDDVLRREVESLLAEEPHASAFMNAPAAEVAIKVLPPAFTADPDRRARFEREARMLATLNHPNICAIYGLEEAAPSAGSGEAAVRFLILELVDGETLAERLAHAPSTSLPLAEALAIARQIADALDAAHEKGIVHRDLKPANIKITPEGVVKVLDFGLAKASSDTLGA